MLTPEQREQFLAEGHIVIKGAFPREDSLRWVRDELSSIENSSRMQADGDTLTLSLPITPYHPNQEPVSTPIGFVLTPRILATVRSWQSSQALAISSSVGLCRSTQTGTPASL